MFELENYVTNGIKPDELAFTKNSISNSDALKYETPRQKASFLSRIQRYNLDKNYTTKQKEILEEFNEIESNIFSKLNEETFNFTNSLKLLLGKKIRIKAN